jgi:hypothetical protein
VRRIGLKSCPYCGGAEELYLSQPKSWHDEVCFFFFLQVVTCHACIAVSLPSALHAARPCLA